MTRRGFFRRLAGAVSAICTGVCWAGRKAAPRRVVRAMRAGRYPGRIVPMPDPRRRGKWSG